jgi:tetratricopeptide (TPR) repeat protein
MFERYLADYPLNAGALFNLGTAYGDAGQFPKAISAFERCVAVNPGYLEAHGLLAQLHRNAGNHAAANLHLQLSQGK